MLGRIKQWLTKIGPISRSKSKLLGKITRVRYDALLRRYNFFPGDQSSGRSPTRLLALRRETLENIPTVFFLGTDEQQDRSGLLQALERAADVRVFMREDGSYGQNDPRPPVVRIPDITRRLWSVLEQLALEHWTPQILISQTWASVIDPEVFSRIRERWGTLIVNISMDDRHQFVGPRLAKGRYGGVRPLIPHLDLALTAAPECVKWYVHEGCPAVFFPEASDPDIFYPMPDLPKIHDVSFVGARYGIREKVITALRRAGIRVRAHGAGWEGGRLTVDEVSRLFAQSRIVLGIGTIGYCDDFYALKLRDFDAPMSGSCYLTHDNPDLHLLYDVGREIVTYKTVDECIAKAKHLLTYKNEREAIARAGRARAERQHTWDNRFAEFFRILQAVVNSDTSAYKLHTEFSSRL